MRDRGELSLRSVMSVWLDETTVMLRRLYAEGGPVTPDTHKLIVAAREAQALVSEYVHRSTDPGHYAKALRISQIEAAEAQKKEQL